jgi:hypothetical protein
MTDVLHDIIESSYELFGKYKASLPLDVCTGHCISEEQAHELVSLSVRHIPHELLYDYNTAAKSENPSIEEFKYFLPRFLELTAKNKFLHHSVELVLSRFSYYRKSDWKDEERTLLQGFGRAYFSQCLMMYPLSELERIDGILIMLSETGIDIEPLLNDWSSDSSSESVLHFSDLVLQGFDYYNSNKLSSPFGGIELAKLLHEWMNQKTTKAHFSKRIEELILHPPAHWKDSQLNELSLTYDQLQMF